MRWYHTIELPDGTTTPGEYDLRPIADRLPWPGLQGLRCLDVGSRDGFYAFEMERRGAAEVVSLDLDDPDAIDMPVGAQELAPTAEELAVGNRAFEQARAALGSNVQRRFGSVYELDGEQPFDVALIGTLLHHLRDPVGALLAIRRAVKPGGRLLVVGAVAPGPSLVAPWPTARVVMQDMPMWFLPNPAGQRRMLAAAGWEIERETRPFYIPWGAGAEPVRLLERPLRTFPIRLWMRRGALHVAVLCSVRGA